MDNRDYSAYPEYDTFMKSVGTVLDTTDETKSYTAPSVVAKVIYKAATDNSHTLRYRAGTDAK